MLSPNDVQASQRTRSWDISKLRSTEKWTYFYRYVVMNVFSRKIVGWSVYVQETGLLPETLILKAADDEKLKPVQLTVHSDSGGPMRSKTLAELFSDLCISKSFNRPHVSNDNPFSESMVKTIKYMPTFPGRFGFCRGIFKEPNSFRRGNAKHPLGDRSCVPHH